MKVSQSSSTSAYIEVLMKASQSSSISMYTEEVLMKASQSSSISVYTEEVRFFLLLFSSFFLSSLFLCVTKSEGGVPREHFGWLTSISYQPVNF